MALRVWGYKQGEVVSLAARTGLHPRWLLEWLRCRAAAGLVESADGQVFELSPEAAALLADEEGSVWFAAGAFQGAAATGQTVDQLAGSFRTGRGLSFDDFGPGTATKVERTLGPWSRAVRSHSLTVPPQRRWHELVNPLGGMPASPAATASISSLPRLTCAYGGPLMYLSRN